MVGAERAAFFEQARAYTRFVSVDVEDATLLVSTADMGVGRSLFHKGIRNEMRLVRRALAAIDSNGEPGVLLDIGANIGTVAISAAADPHVREVFAFEPEPTNVLLLRLNAVASRVEDRLHVLPVAVSDIDGNTELLVSRERSGRHEIKVEGQRKRQRPENWGEAIKVRSVALDSLVGDGTLDPERVKLIWMDTQGHEGHVLKGARSLTERGVPAALELSPKLLRGHGGYDWLMETAERDYTHFVRLHRPKTGLSPISGLPAFVEGFAPGQDTDVLFLRR